MDHPADELDDGALRIDFDRRQRLEFDASRITVRLQLHAPAYNLANFLRTLTLREEVKHLSLTTLRDRLDKIGAGIVRHGRSIAFQMAEVMVPRALFGKILTANAALRPLPRSRHDVERRWPHRSHRSTAAGEPPQDRTRRRPFAPMATTGRSDPTRA